MRHPGQHLGYSVAAIAMAAFGGLAAAGCAEPGKVENSADVVTPDTEQAAAGRAIVVERCASCHGIDQAQVSPLPEAKPMRTILAQYDGEVLAEDLIEGVQVGHSEMPLFDFKVAAADAIVAYLKSLNPS